MNKKTSVYNTVELVWPNEKIQKRMDKETNASFLMGENHNHDLLTFEKLTDDQAAIIRKRVSLLPSGELAVVYLRFWEGLCADEISKTLCLSVGSVNKLLQAALLRLRNNLLELEQSDCA
jgi:DNA-directed RNA polymerase specialized sigma24 family protein